MSRRKSSINTAQGLAGLLALVVFAYVSRVAYVHLGVEAWAGLGLFLFIGSGSIRHVISEPGVTTILFSTTALTASGGMLMAGIH